MAEKKNRDLGIDLRVTPCTQEGKTKAFINMTLKSGDSPVFAVRNMKLIEGSNNWFVSYPNQKQGDEYKDVFYPLSKVIRDRVNELAIAGYDKIMSSTTSDTGEEIAPF